MKNWIKTGNYQILDLNLIRSVWIEDILSLKLFKVMAQDDEKIEWIVGEFKDSEEAKLYLDEIYQKLTHDEEKC